MNPRRLYRSRRDRILAGVAGGMADYLEIDPTIIRILWIISIFFGGFTILLYIILAFIMPLEPATAPATGPWQPAAPAPGPGQPAGAGDARADSVQATGGTEQVAGREAAASSPGDAQMAAGYDPAAPWLVSGIQPAAGYESQPAPREPGRTALYVGVLLVVFGAIAAMSLVVPGLASGGLLVAALVIGLGAALLVGATRRTVLDA